MVAENEEKKEGQVMEAEEAEGTVTATATAVEEEKYLG